MQTRRNHPLIEATPEFAEAAKAAGKQLIAVNGATEFVASYVVKFLLERGYYVRAIHRSRINASFLEQLPGAMQRLQLVSVKDFHSKDSTRRITDALRGCIAVIHAAPVGVQLKRMTSLMPSSRVMDSVDAVLDAASARDSTIKRLVYLSTEMSAFDPLNSTPSDDAARSSRDPLGEEDWYDVSRGDRVSSDYIAYAHTVAEMKLWSRSTRPSIPFTVCSLVPTFAMGAALSPVQLSTAHPMRFLHSCMAGRFAEIPSVPFCPMDVRDIANILVKLVEDSQVSGRVLACPKDLTSTEFIKKCKSIYPRYPWPKQAPLARWVPFWDLDKSDSRRLLKTFYFMSSSRQGHRYSFNNDRVKEHTQIKFRNMEETIQESMDSIVMCGTTADLRLQVEAPKRPEPAVQNEEAK